MWGSGSTLLFCMWLSSCLNTICWGEKKNDSFPHWVALTSLSEKSVYYKDEGLFLDSPSVPLISFSILMSTVHSLDYCIFVINFEISSFDCSIFVPAFPGFLSISLSPLKIFSIMFCSFQNSCTSFVQFISKYFWCCYKWNCFLNFIFNCLFLVCR